MGQTPRRLIRIIFRAGNSPGQIQDVEFNLGVAQEMGKVPESAGIS